jgi:hypothetical protein
MSIIYTHSVVVFARLFIVMGVSWISEIVAWALSPKAYGTVPVYWIVFDIVTLIQAIAIFTIFICRKENLHKLLEKHPFLSRKSDETQQLLDV